MEVLVCCRIKDKDIRSNVSLLLSRVRLFQHDIMNENSHVFRHRKEISIERWGCIRNFVLVPRYGTHSGIGLWTKKQKAPRNNQLRQCVCNCC